MKHLGSAKVDAPATFIVLLMSSFPFIGTLDLLIVQAALPTLSRKLGASTADLQWIIDSYALTFASLLLVGGALGDRYGRIKLFKVGLLIFVISSSAAAWAPSATALILARAAMGIGAALALPASMSTLTGLFSDAKQRRRALGVWAITSGLGQCLGPLAGGILLTYFWWGSIFVVNVILASVVLVVSHFTLATESTFHSSPFDPVGAVLAIVGVAGLLWSTIQAPNSGWTSETTLFGYASAVIALACLVAWELSREHPLFKLSLFRNPRFAVGNVSAVICNIAFTGLLFVIFARLQFGLNETPLSASVRVLPLALMFVIGGAMGPRLAERIGTRNIICAGMTIFSIGAGCVTVATNSSQYLILLVGLFLCGSGYGFVHAPINEAIMGSVSREIGGVASGLNSTTRQFGAALGVAVLGSLLNTRYQAVLSSRVHPPQFTAHTVNESKVSMASALGLAPHLAHAQRTVLAHAVSDGIISGSRLAAMTAAFMLLFGAVVAFVNLPPRLKPSTRPSINIAIETGELLG